MLITENIVAGSNSEKSRLRRSKQFAIVQPSTKTRVDLGLNLKGEPAAGRLEASGSFNSMVSHRVRLEKPADIDRHVKAWLKRA